MGNLSICSPDRSYRYFCENCSNHFEINFSLFSKHIATCWHHLPAKNQTKLRISLFNSLCSQLKIHWSTSKSVQLVISRSSIFEDSLTQICGLTLEQLRTEFIINFAGENANDAGGLTKDFLTSLITSIFTSELRLFEPIRLNSKVYKLSKAVDFAEIYKFTGKIISKSILEGIPLPIRFNQLLLEQILGDKKNFDLDDMKKLDPDLWESFQNLNSNNCDELFMTFTIPDGKSVVELVPEGSLISVNNDNKLVFTMLYSQYECFELIKLSLSALKAGLFEVIPEYLFKLLKPTDLDWIISGIDTINLNDWHLNTVYKDPFSASHPIIQRFWQILQQYDQSQLRKLLFFSIGLESLPIGGFGSLSTLRGDPCLFTISPLEYRTGAFIESHTCFNRLEIPLYPDISVLSSELDLVINSQNQFFKENYN